MGFFDKVKNMFTEEVEDDVKVEQVKKEVTHVSIETPRVKKEYEKENFNIGEIELDESKEFSKPIFFDDNDFEDLNLSPKKEIIEPKYEPQKELYFSKVEEPKEEKRVFKPTPIISPVYGVLDKNYHKEDIVSRKEVKSVIEETEPSIESIRNKAFGTLEDELENTLFGNNSILFKQINNESEESSVELEKINEDALTNLTDDISKELDELLIKKDKYLEKENTTEVTDDLLDFIDSTLYKEGE